MSSRTVRLLAAHDVDASADRLVALSDGVLTRRRATSTTEFLDARRLLVLLGLEGGELG